MASHEIALTRSELDRENEMPLGDKELGNNHLPHNEESQTPRSKDGSDSGLSTQDFDNKLDMVGKEDEDEEWPIQWHYLTFETELPHPTSITPNSSDAPPPPPPPDLTKYTSPFLWSKLQKGIIIWLSVVATAFTAFTAGAYSPGLDQMKAEWNVSTVAILTGITTFTCGFGIAPMVLAPFSEINGRVSWSSPRQNVVRLS
jgi:hypothetical protein